jgi:Uma2 family endonuclease
VINLNEPPPGLMVEVASPSTQTDDYRSKRSEYGLLEISEYWIVDPIDQKITLCVLDHGFYDSKEFQSDGLLVSPAFFRSNLDCRPSIIRQALKCTGSKIYWD